MADPLIAALRTSVKKLRGFQKTSKRLSEHYSRRGERVAWNCRFRSLAAALVPIVRNRPNSIADVRSEQDVVISLESAGPSTVTVFPDESSTGTSTKNERLSDMTPLPPSLNQLSHY